MLPARLVSKTAKLAVLSGRALGLGCFVFKVGENMGGNRVLLLSRQAGNLCERLLQQLGHELYSARVSPIRKPPGYAGRLTWFEGYL